MDSPGPASRLSSNKMKEIERQRLAKAENLTPLMEDFKSSKGFPFPGLSRATNSPEDKINYYLREVPITGENSCFFIALFPPEISLEETSFECNLSLNPPLISFGKEERHAVGTISEEKGSFGQPVYRLSSLTEVPLVTDDGQIQYFSKNYPLVAIAKKGPVFPIAISLSEVTIEKRRLFRKEEEIFRGVSIASFFPPFADQIWSHLKSKPGFIEIFHR